ncbi:2-C-methyl-D-erythritol 2,4-cyclodiphosphate synthase [Fontivita pretiosa]|uniref:2-C-methyl-D-erythritol 2,4-cyclodiphosphate synthase n=1 Tax=Fontivita pretiosa TaxID=2989684 RepID=UPI003D170EAB
MKDESRDASAKQPHRVMVQGLAPARKPGAAEAAAPAAPSSTSSIPFRVGYGYDIHRLQPGGKLVLGGVVVSEQLSAVAHSDGDVVIHALVDALLGAMGWGDIGELFPDTDPRWKGADSRLFLREVCDRLRAARQRVVNVDITILAEKPKLSPFKPQMLLELRPLLGPGCLLNIKAASNEGCDAVGRGEAVAAHAAVLLAAEA